MTFKSLHSVQYDDSLFNNDHNVPLFCWFSNRDKKRYCQQIQFKWSLYETKLVQADLTQAGIVS